MAFRLTRRGVLQGAAGLGVLGSAGRPAGAQGRFEPNWASLDARPIPPWFGEAKFGIFIHWGLYSVPAFGPKGQYAEWYWRKMDQDRAKNGPFWQFHQRVYGADFRYQDFAPQFRAELFDPVAWADLLVRAGARYVVLTSKHHDGFALWPSAQAWNWNAVDVGPHRDLAGDLSQAIRARGLKFGFYYSLFEWYHPLWKTDVKRYVDEHMLPQMKDLVTRYQPSVLWTDGEWDKTSDEWRAPEFLSWLFNETAGGRDIVVNDRWGKETRSKHGGFFTTEYGKVHEGQALGQGRVWEECRGMGASFGWNRNETPSEYKSARDLVQVLAQVVSTGGNLLLNIGPTSDGRIPVEMQDRLLEMGRWLAINGDAIYGTSRFRVPGEGDRVRYTKKGSDVFAIAFDWPGRTLTLAAPRPSAGTRVQLLGWKDPLKFRHTGGKLVIDLPLVPPDHADLRHTFVFRLTGVT